MTDLLLEFNYDTNVVRTVYRESDIWFVLKDICYLLSIKNPRFVWERLDDDERSVGKIYTPGGKQSLQKLTGWRQVVFWG